jgi:FK506-binding nuclear protein
VYLCALVSGQSETCNLDFEFEEKLVTFSVLGPRSVHLAGYYVAYPLHLLRHFSFPLIFITVFFSGS